MEKRENELLVNTFVADDVRSLELRVAAASVQTREMADQKIRVEAQNVRADLYSCEIHSGKLIVRYKMDGLVHLRGFRQDDAKITLYLPAKLALEQIGLEIGAGSVYLDATQLACTKMEVELGAGKWHAAQLSVTDGLSVEIGAGKATMEDVTTGRVEIECGVGSFAYRGRVDGDIRVNCGVGNCSFELENKESDFNYNVSCAVGSVRINNGRVSSFASGTSFKNESAIGTATLECGIGNIEFRTKGIRVKDVK